MPWDSSLGPDAYDDVATKHLIGDWIFAVPPYLPAATTPEDYLQYLRDEGEDRVIRGQRDGHAERRPRFPRPRGRRRSSPTSLTS